MKLRETLNNAWTGSDMVSARTWVKTIPFGATRTLRHRVNGPAVEYDDGSKSWYVDGHALSHESGDGHMNKPMRLVRGPR